MQNSFDNYTDRECWWWTTLFKFVISKIIDTINTHCIKIENHDVEVKY
jgi:hypothetical protein